MTSRLAARPCLIKARYDSEVESEVKRQLTTLCGSEEKGTDAGFGRCERLFVTAESGTRCVRQSLCKHEDELQGRRRQPLALTNKVSVPVR